MTTFASHSLQLQPNFVIIKILTFTNNLHSENTSFKNTIIKSLRSKICPKTITLVKYPNDPDYNQS